MYVICMKYRIIILIIIIIILGQIILSYMANTSSTHPPTHRRRHPGCRCLTGRCAPNHVKVNAPFLPVPLAMNGRSVLHSNKESRICDAVFAIVLGGFSRIKNSSPN